jgi:hypothetical protein
MKFRIPEATHDHSNDVVFDLDEVEGERSKSEDRQPTKVVISVNFTSKNRPRWNISESEAYLDNEMPAG